MELSPDIYRVRFRSGFRMITPIGQRMGEDLVDLALLRCAELTLEKGYHYFVVEGGVRQPSPTSELVYTIKMISEKPTETGSRTVPKYLRSFRTRASGNNENSFVFVYSAVDVQRTMRREYGLQPTP